MNYYYLIDILFAAFVAALSYYFYTRKLYEKLFDYFKLFLLLTVSAKFSSHMGFFLSKSKIIQADSYSVLILIAFVCNFALLYFSYASILKLFDSIINSQKIKYLLAKILTVIEVIIICSFCLYIFMQLKLSKQYLYQPFHKSYTYPYIHKFYKRFLDYDFVYMIVSSDTNVNHKEVIFKSLKNAF